MPNNNIQKTFLTELVLIAIVVAVLHQMALSFSLYWTLDWYDIMMHFLGGVWVGFGTLFIFFTSGLVKITQRIKEPLLILLILILAVLVVGLTWELWELFTGLSNIIEDLGDTILDLIMDVIGGVAAFYYAKDKIKNEE